MSRERKQFCCTTNIVMIWGYSNSQDFQVKYTQFRSEKMCICFPSALKTQPWAAEVELDHFLSQSMLTTTQAK